MTQISCRDLKLGYEGKTVTEGLTFEVSRGDYLCVIGENGAGKSTLIKALLGLNPPISGSISFPGGLSSSAIGYLPQHTAVQKDFPASVKEIVLSGCLGKDGFHPFYTKKQKAFAEKQMDRLGLTRLKNRCYRELSGGQRQRVLLARALCATEEILLLDEPVAGLDPKVTKEMYEIIEDLNKSGVTVIMVSHDISAAVKYASRILHLGPTQLFFGTKDSYIKTDVGRMFTDFSGGEEK
ncbi:MAG: metal ABC transporter ATP-binding protein [Oscillospiraceae bacterium]|nr:metal ABC transporter ATP-binding protein [Oscillospiraceae bacterium]